MAYHSKSSKSMKSGLLKEVDKLIGAPNHLDKQDQYEIEARIGSFRGKQFRSTVNTKDFYRVLEYFLTHTPYLYNYMPDEVTLMTAEYLQQDMPMYPDVITEASFEGENKQRIRESFIDNIPDAPRLYTTKKSLDYVDFRNYFTRISLAKEQYITTVTKAGEGKRPIPLEQEPQALRVKHRWSFALADQQPEHPLFPFRIDLTHVTGWIRRNDGVPSEISTHEIELEVINGPITSAEKQIWPAIRFILQLLQNTEFPVTADTISSVTEGFNDVFGDSIENLQNAMRRKNPRWSFNKSWRLFNVVNKPINFKMNNLEMADHLAVTDKADGERRLMYIRSDGAYLLYPPNDVMRYLRIPEGHHKGDEEGYIYPQRAIDLNGTVLDGELVLRNDGKREYLAFDILADRGKDIRNLKFKDRIAQMKSLLESNPINISIKQFLFPTEDNFYDRVRQVLDSIPHKPYANDGLIFNNIEEQYSTATIYKWKPPEQLSIDFLIRKIDPVHFELYVKSDNSNEPVPFIGSEKYPMSGNAKIDPPVINNTPLETGQIVEMVWDYHHSRFVPLRIRHDRDQPNKLSIALDVWKDIVKPILVSTIRGEDIRLLEHYQKTIKGRLLNDFCEHNTIVNIDTGINIKNYIKLGHETQVLSVNKPEELPEIQQHLETDGFVFDNGRYVLPGKKEITITAVSNPDDIVNAYHHLFAQKRALRSVGCFALFNSLGDFFDKESSLDSLVKTIKTLLKDNGHVLGMSLDLERVRQLLVKHSAFKLTLQKLKPEQYWNLDTNSRINQKRIKKLHINQKWRLVSKEKSTLKKMVAELEEPNETTIDYPSWGITKEKLRSSAYGNKITLRFGNEEKTVYVPDFDTLRKKLSEEKIKLDDSYFPAGDKTLPPEQQQLNNLYRVFSFTRQPMAIEPRESTVEAIPAVGRDKAKISELSRQIKVAQTIIKRAQETVKTADLELSELNGRIKGMGKEIDAEVEAEKEELENKIANAEEKIEVQQKKIADIESERETIEKKIAGITAGVIPALPKAKPPKRTLKPSPSPRFVTPVLKPKLPKQQPPPRPKKRAVKAKPKTVESGKIAIEIEYDANDLFMPVEHPPIATLEPEQTEDLELKNVDFVRIGTIKGRCILASLLRSAYPTYIQGKNEADSPELTESQIEKRKGSIRKLKNAFLDTFFKNAYNSGELSLMAEHYPDWEDARAVLEKCENWQWLGLWSKLASVFKLNIIVITADNPFIAPTIYKTGNSHPRTAVIYNHSGIFDTVGQRDAKGDLVTVFPKDDITINQL